MRVIIKAETEYSLKATCQLNDIPEHEFDVLKPVEHISDTHCIRGTFLLLHVQSDSAVRRHYAGTTPLSESDLCRLCRGIGLSGYEISIHNLKEFKTGTSPLDFEPITIIII